MLQVEAAAFAWVARRTVNRRPGNLPSVTGAGGLRADLAALQAELYGVFPDAPAKGGKKVPKRENLLANDAWRQLERRDPVGSVQLMQTPAVANGQELCHGPTSWVRVMVRPGEGLSL